MTAPSTPLSGDATDSTTTDFDVVVVGAGPAGSSAALVLARAGKRVALIERGPFAGSKNMYGGVIYGRVLDTLIPNWWEKAPIQRWITRRGTVLMTETQSLTIDYRTTAWGEAPYNGATALRPDFDHWLASEAEAAGAVLITSTTVTGLLRDDRGQIVGVKTDRPDGDLRSELVIACDGVNSFLAKEAGLYHHDDSSHLTLGVKEVLGLPREEIEKRFNLSGDEGADFEIVGCTGDIAGGGFVYTNIDSIALGVVLSLDGLAKAQRRPEEIIADLKKHPMIAPLVADAELLEYSAHMIPEGGYDTMPDLATRGLLIAGDAACMCLAAGIWLEGVNFAIGSGKAAGETAMEAIDAGDASAAFLGRYRTKLESDFVLMDHKKLRDAPDLILSDRMQFRYPEMICNIAEAMFTVTNPAPKRGLRHIARREIKRAGIRTRDLISDARSAAKSFG